MRKFLISIYFSLIPFLVFASETAGEAHEAVNVKMELFRIINFLIFAVLLYKFAGKPVINFFKTRKEGIDRAIREAEEARKVAEQRYQEAMKRVENADKEIKEILEHAKKERDEQIELIRKETEMMIERIKEQSKAAADLEIKRAKIELQKEAVDLAVNLAEGLLKEKLTPEDQKRLIQDYITKVKEVH